MLEEATGWAAVVKTGAARGARFTQCEFKHPLGDRLTDAKWRELLAAGELSGLGGFLRPRSWTMNPARRSRTSALAALALLACCIAAPASAAQWALLVGVGDYPGTAFDLEGPAHDVAALRRELVENLGYPEAQVNVLVDANATRANILDALRRLARDAAPSDFVLVYLSGHGTSAYDPNRPVALAHDTGAFVPVDYQAHGSEQRKLDTLLVGSRDLRPVLAAIDEKGVHGLVLIDSCYAATPRAPSTPPPRPPTVPSIRACARAASAWSRRRTTTRTRAC